jgi:hypothetical protein
LRLRDLEHASAFEISVPEWTRLGKDLNRDGFKSVRFTQKWPLGSIKSISYKLNQVEKRCFYYPLDGLHKAPATRIRNTCPISNDSSLPFRF